MCRNAFKACDWTKIEKKKETKINEKQLTAPQRIIRVDFLWTKAISNFVQTEHTKQIPVWHFCGENQSWRETVKELLCTYSEVLPTPNNLLGSYIEDIGPLLLAKSNFDSTEQFFPKLPNVHDTSITPSNSGKPLLANFAHIDESKHFSHNKPCSKHDRKSWVWIGIENLQFLGLKRPPPDLLFLAHCFDVNTRTAESWTMQERIALRCANGTRKMSSPNESIIF